MPDITMCKGTNCPQKESCYRYNAKPSYNQSYFVVPPLKNGNCEMYWGKIAEGIYEQFKEILSGKLK